MKDGIGNQVSDLGKFASEVTVLMRRKLDRAER